MKLVSLYQPWATLVAAGLKRLNTPTWSTVYRGPLAIHASRETRMMHRHLMTTEPYRRAFASIGIEDFDALPRGGIVGVVNLDDVRHVAELGREQMSRIRNSQEWHFGDFSVGRMVWFFSQARLLVEPVICTGSAGVRAVSAEVKERVEAALASPEPTEGKS